MATANETYREEASDLQTRLRSFVGHAFEPPIIMQPGADK